MRINTYLMISLGLTLIALCSIKAEDDFDCTGRSGYYRNPKDPHKFYQCIGEKAFLFNCPENLVFNENTRACDYSVGPTLPPTQPPTAPTGTRQRHGSTDDLRSTQVTGVSTQRPVTGQSTQRPVTGQSTQRPVTGQSTQRPVTGQSTQRPVTEQSTQRPSTPTSNSQPVTRQRHTTPHFK